MRNKHQPYYHSLHPSETPPLLPIPAPSTSRRADIPEADTPPRKRLLLTTPRPGCEIGESSDAAAARQPRPTIETRLLDTKRRIYAGLRVGSTGGSLPGIEERETCLRAREYSDSSGLELRAADRTRQQQIIQTLTAVQTLQRETIPLQGLVTTLQEQVTALQGQVMTLQGQVTALQGQQGPTGGPALPELPEDAGSSS
ncbi:hypothetical protein Tco_0073034 [Tanacetum coccineum]